MNDVETVERQTTYRHSKMFWLAVATFITVFVVNTLGFTDTITGSAMGCGRDWPLCNGQLIPSLWNEATIIEYVHRLSVLLAGPVLLIFSVLAMRKYGESRKVRVLIGLALLGVAVEGVLGALAVKFVNPPAVMAAHLGFALVSFAATLLLAVVIGQIDRAGGYVRAAHIRRMSAEPKFRRLAWLSLPYAYAAIYLGAYVASTGDGSMFTGWPFPTESPHIGMPFWIDWLHRTAALVYLIWMISLVVLARRQRLVRSDLYHGSLTALALVSVQALSGGLMVLTHVSVYAFLIHVTVVSFLFTSQCYLGMQLIGERNHAAENGSEPRQHVVERKRAGA